MSLVCSACVTHHDEWWMTARAPRSGLCNKAPRVAALWVGNLTSEMESKYRPRRSNLKLAGRRPTPFLSSSELEPLLSRSESLQSTGCGSVGTAAAPATAALAMLPPVSGSSSVFTNASAREIDKAQLYAFGRSNVFASVKSKANQSIGGKADALLLHCNVIRHNLSLVFPSWNKRSHASNLSLLKLYTTQRSPSDAGTTWWWVCSSNAEWC